jgi:hypothetical protein
MNSSVGCAEVISLALLNFKLRVVGFSIMKYQE